MVQRVRTSSECRNCTIESTWSANFDIGKVATSDSKASSQGALTGRYTRLRSILGVCAIARSTLPSCSQHRAPGRLTIALPIAIPTPEISSTTELALYFSFICRIRRGRWGLTARLALGGRCHSSGGPSSATPSEARDALIPPAAPPFGRRPAVASDARAGKLATSAKPGEKRNSDGRDFARLTRGIVAKSVGESHRDWGRVC